MAKRFAITGFWRWTCTVACALVLIAWLVSLRLHVSCVTGRLAVGIGGGTLDVEWYPWPRNWRGWDVIDLRRFDGRLGLQWPTFDDIAQNPPPHDYIVHIPLWLPFALTLLPTAVLFLRRRNRPRPGHCHNCGYNLTGNQSGQCPECGTPVVEST